MNRGAKQGDYEVLVKEVADYIAEARRASVRTSTYWLVGRQIVVFEQGGKEGEAYGDALLDRLAKDLNRRLGQIFSR